MRANFTTFSESRILIKGRVFSLEEPNLKVELALGSAPRWIIRLVYLLRTWRIQVVPESPSPSGINN